MNKRTVYAAFCGTGKTYICDNININSSELECWRYYGIDFPSNYIKDILAQSRKVNYLFISTNPEVLKELNKVGVKIVLVYPQLKLREEYLRRYVDRGSSKDFVCTLKKHWVDWIKEIQQQHYCEHIILKSSEYLSDLIKFIDNPRLLHSPLVIDQNILIGGIT